MKVFIINLRMVFAQMINYLTMDYERKKQMNVLGIFMFKY